MNMKKTKGKSAASVATLKNKGDEEDELEEFMLLETEV